MNIYQIIDIEAYYLEWPWVKADSIDLAIAKVKESNPGYTDPDKLDIGDIKVIEISMVDNSPQITHWTWNILYNIFEVDTTIDLIS